MLILPSTRAQVSLFSLANWDWVASPVGHALSSAVASIVPNAAGTHFICVGADGAAVLHHPLADSAAGINLPLPDFPAPSAEEVPPPQIMWDQADR